MALQTTGEVSVDVERTVAFNFLQNPQRLAACIPGCRDVRELAPGRYEVRWTRPAPDASEIGVVELRRGS